MTRDSKGEPDHRMTSANVKRVIVDTDPGVDDLAAIYWLLSCPHIKVEALTTVFGNGTVEHTTENANILLEVGGRADIPVYPGAAKPLLTVAQIGKAIHGIRAFGDSDYSLVEQVAEEARGGAQHKRKQAEQTCAAAEIVRRVMVSPGEITVIGLGPLTNIALALAAEPRLAGAIKELVVMGGAVLTQGNITSVATANFFNDPDAAAIVYASGVNLVQVGMGVCNNVKLSKAQLARIYERKNLKTKLLSVVSPQLREYYVSQGNQRPRY
eukprot:TRINITY_DN6410_c0_g1_i3.p1 TRINITY_DN6410_c0_g1~~TRINITY_DN6410_c0_g1_i3.p1  ORF type:complete len:269 (+),score=56.67 TRINITY_DN6410_c0_g1_i3:81-887(+)